MSADPVGEPMSCTDDDVLGRLASIDHRLHQISTRLVPRLGKEKTIVALEHSILTAVWHMLTHNVDCHDLGGDYFTRRNPERAMQRIIRQANALGFTVRFDPIQAA